MEWRKENFQIESSYDGLLLDVLTIAPKGDCRGILQISHGMCEHKERYQSFMEYMALEGFACVIHDHRGHGKSIRSQEDLGYFYKGGGNALAEDLRQVMQRAKKRWKGKPVILFGHSMGSLVVRNYIKKYDDEIDILIVCGSPSKRPALWVGAAIVEAQRRLSGDRHRSTLLEGLSFGMFNARFAKEKNRFAWVCSLPEVYSEYESSPLCGFTFTVDAYQGLFQLMKETYGKRGWVCKNPNLPILFIGGEEDPCIGSQEKLVQAMKHLKHVGYRNVTGKLYPHMRHEILNEKGKGEVYRNVLSYITKKIKSFN